MPTTPRLTVALTFDHDSVSDGVRRNDLPVKLSRAEFGHRVGVPRILELLQREQVPSSWFVPGHTLVTFPEDAQAILAGGHEIGCHGWFHEDHSELSESAQRDVIQRSFDAAAAAIGEPPKGHRAPYWILAPETLGLIEEIGFTYDSSLMADDYRLHRVRHGDRHTVEGGSSWGSEGRLVDVPVYWALDDWTHFEPGEHSDGLSAPSKVLEIWLGEVRYAHQHAPGGVVTITMHPECIGRGHRMAMLEQFIAEVRSLDGVVFERLDRVVGQWLEANPGV